MHADREALKAELSSILPDRPEARFLGADIYVSKEIAELEKRKIFMKSWLCVAREEEVPQVNDYMSMRICNEPIVIARDSADHISVFLNMCLHRGVEVVQGKGNARRFSCPYHAWTYDTSGRLVGTPLVDAASPDSSEMKLQQLRTAFWRGWIFINFDPEAEPFEQYIAPFEKDLWYYKTGEARLATKIEFDVNCNWKFFAENICDYYHLKTVHGPSSGQFYQLGSDELPLRTYDNGGSSVVFDSSMRKADTILPFPPLPWLKEHAFSAKGEMFPNINFWCGLDSLRMWHIWPIAPDKTHAVCYVLMPEASFKVDDFDAKIARVRAYVEQIIAEDGVTITSLQNAAGSMHYRPGRVTHLESMVHHLSRHYAKVMAED